MTSNMALISLAELSKHDKAGDMWVAVDGEVYDVSKFAKLHPGGAQIIEQYAGKDVSQEFYELHRKDVLAKYARLRVARLDTGTAAAIDASIGFSMVPYAEMPVFQGANSPFYKESHKRLLLAVRKFVQEEMEPIAESADLAGSYPDRDLQKALGASGLMLARMGPGPWLKLGKGLGIPMPGDVDPDEFDYFHEAVIHQEVGRLGRPGFIDSLGAGWTISAPAIFHFAKPAVRDVIGPQLLRGEKWSCLAISEPFAGSDVAAIRCTAEKTPCGRFYIVNGLKKWITEGAYADYFVTAVRTGDKTAKGISMLLIERGPGVETKQIKTTYSTCCGTAMVIFHNVKVPVENLFGKEGDGFMQIMYNFNHERWMIVQSLTGQARAALTDTFMWSKQRSIFGKLLIDQPVIRNKLADAMASMESLQTHMDCVTYDMCKTKGGALNPRLAGPIALLKYNTTRTCWKVLLVDSNRWLA
eukprot:TRINITY_DN45014_c0_g3_i1.p1 TRINITY_DN45014_c0_g3~~TRINITY_DN45014_c0_g3_i1.p1  ORF type:complete len:471 (+),score=88.79 TRINITY_DN45014_c0_g3_i1:120-1532(+)